MKRNMVTIRTVKNIEPIEGADFVEKITIDGWHVVSNKSNGFTVGDKVLFFEIDSLLSDKVDAFADINAGTKHKSMTRDDGVVFNGGVLRTKKIRGVYSQGLAMPLDVFGLDPKMTQDEVDAFFADKVIKWEAPAIAGSNTVSTFPSFIRKTDSERIQNVDDNFLAALDPDEWFATEKIDGMSTTFWKDEDGDFHVASRNHEINMTDAHKAVVERYNIADRLGPLDWVQGELFGSGIQSNRLQLADGVVDFRAFNSTVPEKMEDISVPRRDDLTLPRTVEDGIAQVVKMRSSINPKVQAEGVVWWNRNGNTFKKIGDRANFKSINPDFLAKEK